MYRGSSRKSPSTARQRYHADTEGKRQAKRASSAEEEKGKGKKMNSKKKLLSLALVLVLIFQMLPVAAFADGFAKADGSPPSDEERPRIEDDLYYAGAGRTYEADDVLWEIEEQRTETEKHFRLANGSDIAVAYAYPVHYKDSAGEYQEILFYLNLSIASCIGQFLCFRKVSAKSYSTYISAVIPCAVLPKSRVSAT